MLVLLIIFMVTAPMIQRGIDVNLPVARRAQRRSPASAIVRHRAARPTAQDQHRVPRRRAGPRGRPAGARPAEDGNGAPTSRCILRGDGGVQLQELMDVFDRLKAAGVENVGHRRQDAGRTIDVDVTDVLRDRMQRAGRARSGWSPSSVARARGAGRGARARARRAGSSHATERPTTVMTITLGGGGAGPQNGGMTAIGGRPVQAADAADEPPKREAVRAAGGQGAGDDGADCRTRSRRRRRRRRREAGARRSARPDADARRGERRRAAPSPRPARAARASGCRPAAAPGSGLDARRRRLLLSRLPRHDGRARSGATGTSRQKCAGDVVVKFTIQRDGTITDVDDRAVERLRRRSTSRAQRAVLSTRQLPPLPAAFPESHADRSPQFPVPTMTDHSSDPRPRAAGGVGRARGSRRRRQRRRRRSRPRAAAERDQHDDQRRRRRAAAARRARFHRAVAATPRRSAIAKTIGAGAVGRPELRARVRAHPARHLRDDSGGDVVRRRAVRSLARAERRRRRRRHRAEDGHRRPASRCGCSTSRTRQSAFGKEYSGSAANPRLYAHTISDEIHQQQRGAARRRAHEAHVRLRSRRRAHDAARSRTASVKEIYIADYDGENQRRVTTSRTLNITPTWSPDARSIAYTSYRRGPPNIFISNIYQGTLRGADEGRRRELAAGVVARRHAHRLHVDARRQRGDLRR